MVHRALSDKAYLSLELLSPLTFDYKRSSIETYEKSNNRTTLAFISASHRMQYSIADLSFKIVFWTHKFAVGLIDMGNSRFLVNSYPFLVNS